MFDTKAADNFFNNVDYVSIIDTIRGIFTSDGSMSTLLDFERVLDEADLYAFKNWEFGELVQGPTVKKYSVSCIFMYPYKMMPDPRGAKRLASIGCSTKFKKTKIKVPVQVENYDDYMPGTRYPKMVDKEVWLILVEMPKELMNEIREGSIDLADQTIDLEELDNSYEDDLDQDEGTKENSQTQQQGQMGQGMPSPMMPGATTPPAM
jgi:hypothetical protein